MLYGRGVDGAGGAGSAGTGFPGPLSVGAHYGPSMVAPASSEALGGAVAVIGVWDMVFVWVGAPATWNQIELGVATAVAGSLIRLGVYEWPGFAPPYPSPSGVWSLVADGGVVDCSTTGAKVANVSPFTKANTLLGLIAANQPAVAATSATLSALRADTMGASWSPLGYQSNNGPINGEVRCTSGTGGPLIAGAFPSTLDLSGGGPTWNRVAPLLSLVRSA